MIKEKFDLVFILLFLSILTIARPFFFSDLTIFNIIYSFVPIILLSYFWFFHLENFILNFIITFISFFIIIDIKPWFIQWENHVITAILAAITAFAFTSLFKQAQNQDPLEGTFLNILIKKIPKANTFVLFLLDTLMMSTILSIVFSLVVQRVEIWFILGAILICSYHSASAIYFFLYLPQKNKPRKRKRKKNL